MRKCLLLLFLLFILTGCTIVDDSKEYRDLSKQFDQLVIEDLHNKDGFDRFYNEITKNMISSNLKLHVKIYSEFGFLVENRYGTAMIYDDKEGYYYALSTSSLISVNHTQTMIIDVYDYLGNKYLAQNIKSRTAEELISFQIVKTTVSLSAFSITPYTPVINEPIFMIGNPNHTQNTILFGSYLGINEQENMLTNIKTDAFANGSAILNVAKNCIGIQIGFNEDTLIFLSATEILEFILLLETDDES